MSIKTRAEMETVIRQSAEDKTWIVFTEVPRTIRRMERIFGPGTKKSAIGYEWRNVPQSAVRVCKPARRAAATQET